MEQSTIQLKIPPLFSFKEIISFLDRGFDDCMYHLTSDSVTKAIRFNDGEVGIIRINEVDKYLDISIHKPTLASEDTEEVALYVTDWFDLNKDLSSFYQRLNDDPNLSFLSKKYFGSRIVSINDLFETLCWAIMGQQINLRFAYKTKRSLVEKLGTSIVFENQIYYIFPDPTTMLNTSKETLKQMQLSRQKIDYLYHASRSLEDGILNKEKLSSLRDFDQKVDLLCTIKGIGIWSANYVLMKCIGEDSCITYGDSGLNNAIKTIFNLDHKPSNMEINHIFKNYKNWESYLNFYLWKTLQ